MTDTCKQLPTLVAHNGQWYVDYQGSEQERDILDLFHTTLIVTPFSVRHTTREQVKAKIKERVQ